MTDVEAKELEEKNRLLRNQMLIFEEKTKRIQQLLQQADLFDKGVTTGVEFSSNAPLPTTGKVKEDMLPKVIICGTTENDMPKIIVCNDKKKKAPKNNNNTFPVPLHSPVSDKNFFEGGLVLLNVCYRVACHILLRS